MRAICQTVYGIRYKTHILHMTAEEYGGPGPGSGSKASQVAGLKVRRKPSTLFRH